MSNFRAITKNPMNGRYEWATWLDNYFGPHNYGVKFEGSMMVLDDRKYDLKTRRWCCKNHDGDCGMAGMGTSREDRYCCKLCPDRQDIKIRTPR